MVQMPHQESDAGSVLIISIALGVAVHVSLPRLVTNAPATIYNLLFAQAKKPKDKLVTIDADHFR